MRPATPSASTIPDWRAALARWDPNAARLPASAHAAQLLASKGDRLAARAVYRELVDRQPNDVRAWKSLAQLHRQLGDHAAAADCLRSAHTHEVAQLQITAEQEEATATFFMAAEGYAESPDSMPNGYVEALFDRYADHFDEHLDTLGYRAPLALFDIVERHRRGSGRADTTVLDLGCGTGLAGARFRPQAGWLEGVDLSGAMVEQARGKSLYDHLAQAELVAYLADGTQRADYDLILAADVFNYLGDVGPALDGCAARLARQGLLAFTVEIDEADAGSAETDHDYHLRRNRRYAHEPDRLSESISRAGLRVISLEPEVLRYEQDTPVASLVCLCAGPDG